MPTPIRKLKRSILVADPDLSSLEVMRASQGAKIIPILTCTTGKDALQLLSDLSQPIAALFINPKITLPNSVLLIRFAHLKRPALPIYVLYDKPDLPFTQKELDYLGVIRAYGKPASYNAMVKLIQPNEASDEAEIEALIEETETEMLQTAAPSAAALSAADRESAITDAHYFSASVDELLAHKHPSQFNAHIRLAAGAYVKILGVGEVFSSERILDYRKKNISHFFVLKDEYENYLAFRELLAAHALTDSKLNPEIRVGETVRHGDESQAIMRSIGFRESHVRHGVQFIQNLNDLVDRTDLSKRHSIFGAFMENISVMEHGTSIAILASLAARYLKAPVPTQSLGLAALFHDVGLLQLPLAFQDEDESKMDDDQLAAYRAHPAIGAHILRTSPLFDAPAVLAVEQHHFRMDRKRFKAANPPKTNPMGELIGISDEFWRMLMRTKLKPKLHPVTEMEKDAFLTFSSPVVAAFKDFLFTALI